ncbi:MAG: hypothetical protein AAFX99_22580, partial [Myxococcota bacterium]
MHKQPSVLFIAIALAGLGCATTPSTPADSPTQASFPDGTYALVWADAQLHTALDSEMMFQAYDFGEDGRDLRQAHVFVVRVLQRHGAWFQITTDLADDGEHCIKQRLINNDGIGLEFWIHEHDLTPVLRAPIHAAFGDGTSVTLLPGTPVVDSRPWVHGLQLQWAGE